MSGVGRLYVSRNAGNGGSYHRYCEVCLDRYCAEPNRKRWEDLRATVKPDTYGTQFTAALCKLFGVRKAIQLPFFPWTEHQTAEFDRLRLFWRAQYEADQADVVEVIAQERAVLEADHAKA
jgi:hypothetical protein